MNIVAILAQAAAPAGGQGGVMGGPGGLVITMLIIFAIFYFMMIRPQMRKDKERKEMINNVKSGEKVMFSGGILGTVTNVKEHTFTIKIADNVKIEVARGAVAKVLDKDEKPEVDDKNK
jgi:preprotein translocase subunit YajC